MSKKIALDIDDVLAAFYPAMCIKYKKPELKVDIWDGKEDCKWLGECMPEVDADPSFYYNLDVLSHPNTINFDFTCYITSSPQSLVYVRKAWLSRNGFPDKPVLHSKDKLGTMKSLGIDILVDDKISTIETINKGNRIALQFKPPYMSAEIEDKSKIITHLSEVNKWLN